MGRRPVLATVHGHEHRCQVCRGQQFRRREVRLNSTGAEFLGFAWANESATGLICIHCGNVQLFVGSALQLYDAPR